MYTYTDHLIICTKCHSTIGKIVDVEGPYGPDQHFLPYWYPARRPATDLDTYRTTHVIPLRECADYDHARELILACHTATGCTTTA